MESAIMIILGITGSIASGKSYALECFSSFDGVEVLSSDAEIHKMYEQDKDLIKEISDNFPQAVKQGVVDRKKLAELIFEKPQQKKLLESITHPALAKRRDKAITSFKVQGIKLLALEIPLLFEVGLDKICDYVLTVYCSPEIQKQRAMKRPWMTEEKFQKILSVQMPYKEKIKRSDFSIDTGGSKEDTLEKIEEIYAAILAS